MKHRALKFAALVGAMSMPAVATAQPGDWYVAIDVGQHWTGEVNITPVSEDVDIGVEQDWSTSLRVGRNIGEHWRVEVELSDRPAEYASSYPYFFHGDIIEEAFSGELNATSLMGNVIYDFAPGQRIRPFVGVGVGEASFEVRRDFYTDPDESAFAWQALAGASWRLTEAASLDFTYRYFASEIETPMLDGMSYRNQGLSVGLRYAF